MHRQVMDGNEKILRREEKRDTASIMTVGKMSITFKL